MDSCAIPALQHRVLKRTSKLIGHDRRSFRHLSRRADHLEQLHLAASSSSAAPEAVAAFLLTKQQEAIETRLHQQQQHHHHRFTFHRPTIDLLRSSADCSWHASLLCAAFFIYILDARRSLARIQSILDSSAAANCHSQVDDLLLALAELQRLLDPQETRVKIENARDLLGELISDLNCHRRRMTVRALSQITALKSRARDDMLPALGHLKAKVRSKLCLSDGQYSVGNYIDDNSSDEDGDVDGASDARNSIMNDSDVIGSSAQQQQHMMSVFTRLHKVNEGLLQVEKSMVGVSTSLQTLIPLLSATHNDGLGPRLIESLRDDPLMLEAMAALIAGCNESASNHLWDVREQVLNCFYYLNRARDHAYEI